MKPNVILHVQDTVELNFEMAVGSVSESMTVAGGAPLANTESAAVSTVIDRNFVESLPLNGRSFNTLLQLTPGVVIAPQFQGRRGSSVLLANEQTANNFMVDGVSANFGSTASFYIGNLEQERRRPLAHSGGQAVWFPWRPCRSFVWRHPPSPRNSVQHREPK